MKIVDTKTRQDTRVARYADGSVNFNAYRGLTASFEPIEGINVNVTITDARQRFGHLDLLVTPISGSGSKWIEHKNINFHNSDPVDSESLEAPEAPASTPIHSPSLAESVRDIINQSTSTLHQSFK